MYMYIQTPELEITKYATWAWQGQTNEQHCRVRFKKIVDKMSELNTNFVKHEIK